MVRGCEGAPRMNVTYTVPVWPSPYATYVFRELQWMRARGHRVAVISVKPGPPEGAAAVAAFGLQDMPVLQLGGTAPTAAAVAKDGALDDALAFVRTHDPGVINAHMGREAADLARRIRARTGVPYVVRLYGGDVHSNPAPNLAELLDEASLVCSVSAFLADLLTGRRTRPVPPPGLPLRHLDRAKLRICHDGLAEALMADDAVPQSDEQPIVVGSIGRLAPLKRHADIVEAVAGLTAESPGLRLRLIGGGDLMAPLQQQAQALGVGDRVDFTGPLPWSAVLAETRRLHIYVQASSLEGFCTSSVEAACQGLPLLLSRTGIHEELVAPGVNGDLFEPGDVAALRERLRHLLDIGAGRRREMGAASLRIARRCYVLERLLPRLEAMFEAVADGRTVPA
jgi:glycosyltransferase involved in cell wall biosynthesis